MKMLHVSIKLLCYYFENISRETIMAYNIIAEDERKQDLCKP